MLLRECRGLHGDLEALAEWEAQLGDVLATKGWSQQVKQLSARTEELQLAVKTRLQSLQDAVKVKEWSPPPPRWQDCDSTLDSTLHHMLHHVNR